MIRPIVALVGAMSVLGAGTAVMAQQPMYIAGCQPGNSDDAWCLPGEDVVGVYVNVDNAEESGGLLANTSRPRRATLSVAAPQGATITRIQFTVNSVGGAITAGGKCAILTADEARRPQASYACATHEAPPAQAAIMAYGAFSGLKVGGQSVQVEFVNEHTQFKRTPFLRVYFRR